MRKRRTGTRPYRVATLAAKPRIDKTRRRLTHAEMRLKQRTSMKQSELAALRSRIDWKKIPPGHHHIRMSDGIAVLKDVGRKKPHHVFATVLPSGKKRPPGRELSSLLKAASWRAFSDEMSQIFRAAS